MAASKGKRKGGRPTIWDEKVKDRLDFVTEQIGRGVPEYRIAEGLGICADTFIQYKKNYPELIEAIKKGNERKLENVEQSLYKGAVGYEYEEVKEIISKDRSGKTSVKKEITKKHYQPNPTLIIFTLLNLMGDKYKDRKDIRLSGSLDTKSLTDEDIMKRVKELEEITGTGDHE